MKSFRATIRRGCTVMPGVFNGASARLAERAGFRALYVSGAGLANATAGVPDIGLLARDEVVRLTGHIARAVRVPVLVDADTGFDDAAKTVRDLEAAGAAGLHIEDQMFPKRCGHLAGKSVIPAAAMCRKLRAALKARRNLVIIARTDARGVEGFDAAVGRARQYLAAGADGIFPEGLESRAEFAEFARQVKAPLLANMTEFGQTPMISAREFAKMGYRMVIFPMSAFRVSMNAMDELYRQLKRAGTQKAALKKMQTRAELYELLRYDPMKEWRR
jgi:methylisocitrate lyase